jgi:hypothetical protein
VDDSLRSDRLAVAQRRFFEEMRIEAQRTQTGEQPQAGNAPAKDGDINLRCFAHARTLTKRAVHLQPCRNIR